MTPPDTSAPADSESTSPDDKMMSPLELIERALAETSALFPQDASKRATLAGFRFVAAILRDEPEAGLQRVARCGFGLQFALALTLVALGPEQSPAFLAELLGSASQTADLFSKLIALARSQGYASVFEAFRLAAEAELGAQSRVPRETKETLQ